MTRIILRCESFDPKWGHTKEILKTKQFGNCFLVPLHRNLKLPEGLVDWPLLTRCPPCVRWPRSTKKSSTLIILCIQVPLPCSGIVYKTETTWEIRIVFGKKHYDLNLTTDPFLTNNYNIFQVVSFSLPGRHSSTRTDVERDENLHYHPVRTGNDIINSKVNKFRTQSQDALRRLCEAT